MSVNNEWFNNVVKKKSKDWDKWEHNNPKSLRHSESRPKTEICSFIGLPQERKISNNLILHLKELEKEQQPKPKVSGRKKII